MLADLFAHVQLTVNFTAPARRDALVEHHRTGVAPLHGPTQGGILITLKQLAAELLVRWAAADAVRVVDGDEQLIV